MTLTLSGFAGKTIKGIKLFMRSNANSGAGSLSVTAGSTKLASIDSKNFNSSEWAGKYSTAYIEVTPKMSNDSYVIKNGEDLIITISASVSSLYNKSFTIIYE